MHRISTLIALVLVSLSGHFTAHDIMSCANSQVDVLQRSHSNVNGIALQVDRYGLKAGDKAKIIITPHANLQVFSIEWQVLRLSFYSTKHKELLFLNDKSYYIVPESAFKNAAASSFFSHMHLDSSHPFENTVTALTSGHYILRCVINVKGKSDKEIVQKKTNAIIVSVSHSKHDIDKIVAYDLQKNEVDEVHKHIDNAYVK